MSFYPLAINNIYKLTNKSTFISFSIPQNLQKIFNQRKAGQFIRIQFNINNNIEERQYSICSSPSERDIAIVVKEVNKGKISTFITQPGKLNIGDILMVSSPLGNFTISSRPDEKRTLAAFCAGSGITPIISILKDVLEKEKFISFYLFYGNTTKEEILFKEQLEELKIKFPNNIFIYYFFSRQPINDPFFQGRLNDDKLSLIINQIIDWDEVDEVLLCGPKGMIINLANAVYIQRIPKKNIHFELFEPINQVLFNDEKIKSTISEKVDVKVNLDGNIYEIKWKNDGTSLLDELLKNDIKVPYSCKGGICGSCICTRKQGEVLLYENMVLTEKDIEEKKILACVSFPLSNYIEIIF